MSEPTPPESMSSPAASPASPSATRVAASVVTTRVGFGLNSTDVFAYFDRDSSSWKTSQDSLLADSAPSSLIWPKAFTWDGAFAYELPMSVPPTDESESSSLLPTPVAHDDGKSPEAHRQMKANLEGGPRTRITSLSVLARAGFEQPLDALLPTPSANDSTGAEGPTRKDRQERTNWRTGGSSLRDMKFLLPTPAADWRGSDMDSRLGSPSLRDVETLLPSGETTLPRSSAGSESSDEPHPHQLTLEDA